MSNWKKIFNFENYSVSDSGEVRNDVSGKILKPNMSTCGYQYVHLMRNGKKHLMYIHRLVCIQFLGIDEQKKQVDHIDGDKTNNNLNNLRWVTPSENSNGYGKEQRAEARKRKVYAFCDDGRKIIFDSRKEAAEHFNCSDSKIKYGYFYKRGNKKGWRFEQAEDIV